MSDSGGELSAEKISTAVREAGLSPLSAAAAERFSIYFELLQRWNAKLNLTSIRNASDILEKHFMECIFCARSLPSGINTLLDFGSGAGFPGIPIALCCPDIRVTLAESQGKKASFLREVVRTLGIDAEVYAGRVSEMPSERIFDAVTLRAVDAMREAVLEGATRVRDGGWLVLLTSAGSVDVPTGFFFTEVPIPCSAKRVVILAQRAIPADVPRETLGSPA